MTKDECRTWRALHVTGTIDSTAAEFSELERYELREPIRYKFSANRREFVQILGAGVAVAVTAEVSAQRPGGRSGSRGPRREEKLGERFHLSEEGIVTVFTSKVEVGQGSRTQITQAAAEELRMPVEQIRVVMADTERCPDDGGTAGSRTTPSTVPRIRNAAAALRQVLVQAAATQMQAEPAAVEFEAGQFKSGNGVLSLAELVKAENFTKALDAAPPVEVPLTEVSRWKVLGTSVDKVAGRDVVTGAAQFPSDVIRPEMLYGKVMRPPAFGAKLESLDTQAAKEHGDVVVVHDGDFAGCAAATSFLASTAVTALAATAKWNVPASQVTSETLFDHLTSQKQTTPPADSTGPLKDSGLGLDATYTVAYIQHAPMEPRAAVAEWNDGKLTVWTGTQQPSRVQGELCQVFRLPTSAVRVVVPDTGGGFGGRHTGEAAVEAARLAKAAGKPVSLRWTREEEFTWAYFRPAGVIKVQAAVDSSGKLTLWDFTNYNSGGSAIETPYRVPSPKTRTVDASSPLRQGSYRALASTANTFARESAMDELAALVSMDPLEFRLKNLDAGRLRDVLLAAAERFGWRNRSKQISPNRGIGLACGTEKGSFTAACAEVEMVDGKPIVSSICQAFECGAIQNPRNLRAQVEGSIVMGLGGALMEKITFKEGRVTNPNFANYRVPRMDDVPPIEIVLVDRPDLPSVGGGETPIIAIAPAIANAIHRATGKRLRAMPMV